MLKLHPEILRKNGKEQFVVLPYEEFIQLQEQLADADDLRELRLARRKEKNAPTIRLTEVRRKLRARKPVG